MRGILGANQGLTRVTCFLTFAWKGRILALRIRGPLRSDVGQWEISKMLRDECHIGCMARAQVRGRRAVVGPIVGTSHNGTCWVLRTHKGEQAYHKSHCQRVGSDRAGRKAREYKQAEKAKMNAKARAVLGLNKVYGDGELD